MAFGIGLTPAQIARKDREYRSSQGSPFANSARYRNPHPPLSLTNKGRGHSKSNVKTYKLQWRAQRQPLSPFSLRKSYAPLFFLVRSAEVGELLQSVSVWLEACGWTLILSQESN